MLKRDLSIDPTTGLPNLFGLLEAAYIGTFGVKGAVIAADIHAMASVNAKYGRKAGDACIRCLAGVLRTAAQNVHRPTNADGVDTATEVSVAFRIGGDSFILVMPGESLAHAEQIAAGIREEFQRRMLNHGVVQADLHLAMQAYDVSRHAPSSLIKIAYLALDRSQQETDIPRNLPPWAETLIDNMAERTYETLTALREARSLALSDEISGLPNHRAAEIFMEDMLHEYEVNGEACSVLLVDGDNLKAYNELGYQRGNQMIRDLAGIISGAVRYGDRVARWLSGDEFVVILPGADKPTALQIAERLRVCVEVSTQHWSAPVTVSIGVATCPDDGTTTGQLMAWAEKRNSAAKRAGKNQVS